MSHLIWQLWFTPPLTHFCQWHTAKPKLISQLNPTLLGS